MYVYGYVAEYITSIACNLFALVFLASLLSHGFVEGRPTKGTIKTIRSSGGDIIDCVDIHQ
ncbi:hypothetical protein RJ641_015919 [Dillenia turbinata]|uniref:Uncharacterized protein n=1 Tax=Dillenia turbinata TaxID=194707 RepID=A0AAN8UQV3_9MAGN